MTNETQLQNSWLWQFHKDSPTWKKVRLGKVSTQFDAKIARVFLRFADAIFIEEDVVNIVETKISPKADAIGQLLLYERLFKETPEFSKYKDFPIKKIMLTTREDPAIRKLAEDHGIEVIIYSLDDPGQSKL